MGLQYGILKKGAGKGFKLRPKDMKTWPRCFWCFFLILIVKCLGATIYLSYFYFKCGVLPYYAVLFCIIILTFVVVTCAVKETHYLHLHHYTFAMIVVVLTGY